MNKKHISINKSDLILAKIFDFFLFLLSIWVIYLFISDNENLLGIVVSLIISMQLFKFLWAANQVSIDDSFFYVSDFRNLSKIPIDSVIKIQQSFFSEFFAEFLQFPTIKLTFKANNNKAKHVLFVPDRKAFEGKNVTEELRKIIEKKKAVTPDLEKVTGVALDPHRRKGVRSI